MAAIVAAWPAPVEWLRWIPLVGLYALLNSHSDRKSKASGTLGSVAGLLAALPISFDEIASLWARVIFRRAIWCIAPLAAFGWLAARCQGVWPLEGLLQVATIFLL